MEAVPHYFFVDNKNELHLIYPDYVAKSHKFEIISQIKKERQIEQADFRQYKRIIVQNFEQKKGDLHGNIEVEALSCVQRTDDLKMILNHKSLTKDKILNFCKDDFDQVLYVYQTDLPSIVVIQMRD